MGNMERKFEDGKKFEGPDGVMEITGLARDYDRIVYAMEYKDVPGEPSSPLAQEELINNEEIQPL